MQTLRSLVPMLCLGLLPILASCGGSPVACPTIAAANFTVVVTDAATGQRICDATVTAQDSATSESASLSVNGGASDCGYSGGFYERPGTFTITATKTGYLSASKSGVAVTKGECNVVSAQVALQLTH